MLSQTLIVNNAKKGNKCTKIQRVKSSYFYVLFAKSECIYEYAECICNICVYIPGTGGCFTERKREHTYKTLCISNKRKTNLFYPIQFPS